MVNTVSPANPLPLRGGSPRAYGSAADYLIAQASPATLAGLALWLDPANISGVADGGNITTWPDASGNGRDVTAAGTGNPILRTSSAVVTLPNSRPVVQFADSGAAYLARPASGMSNTTGFTMFAVVKGRPASINVDRMLIGVGSNATPTGNRKLYVQGSNWLQLDRSNTQNLANGAATPIFSNAGSGLAYTVTEAVYDPAGTGGIYTTLLLDGKTTGTGSTALASAFTAGSDLVIGANMNGTGINPGMLFGDIICFDRVLTANERGIVETYLHVKYGTP